MSSTRVAASHLARFDDTHWSLIRQACREDPTGTTALNELFSIYRAPLYCFVRQRGFSPADAEDITQGFLLDLIERAALQRVDPEKGRFRSFLLGSLKNFLANEWDRRRARKRGGGTVVVSLDEPQVEALFVQLADERLDAERMFDRAWALDLLGRAMRDLREEYRAEGRLELFRHLEPVLSMDGKEVPYSALARRLLMQEAATRMAVMRLRRRFRKILMEAVLRTVTDPADSAAELRYLISCC